MPVEVEGVAQPKDEDDIQETEKSGEDGHMSPGEGDQVDRKSLEQILGLILLIMNRKENSLKWLHIS